MKKIYKSLLLVAIMLISTIGLSACGAKKEIESIYVDLDGSSSILVLHKSDWDPTEELTIKAKLKNGKEISIDAEDCDFSGVDTDETGRQTLTVTYNIYECTVAVDVYAYVSSIEVAEGLQKDVDHHANNDVYNVTAGKIRLNFSDGTSQSELIPLSECEVTAGSTATIGTHTITITYQGVSVEYSYNVHRTVTALAISGYPTSVNYGEEYDYSLVSLTATYSTIVLNL